MKLLGWRRLAPMLKPDPVRIRPKVRTLGAQGHRSTLWTFTNKLPRDWRKIRDRHEDYLDYNVKS